jgi:Protein of unknown function (DUF1569)
VTDYFKPSERDNLFRRIEELTPTMRSRDGRVTGHQMICHLGDSLREVLGLQAAGRRGTIVHRTVLKWLAFHLIPWPESQPRSEAAIKRFVGQTAPSTYAADHAAFVALLRQFDERWQQGQLAPHPVFGSLSKNEWGAYMFLHIDHHLATFGIHGEPHVPQRSTSP